jgi:16S rRNA (uracil1498-N3)-methyltransferase
VGENMQKLFIDYTPEKEILLEGEQARHIAKSLRMKVGDMLCVTDGKGNDFGCQIDEITNSTVHLEICYKQANMKSRQAKKTSATKK